MNISAFIVTVAVSAISFTIGGVAALNMVGKDTHPPKEPVIEVVEPYKTVCVNGLLVDWVSVGSSWSLLYRIESGTYVPCKKEETK